MVLPWLHPLRISVHNAVSIANQPHICCLYIGTDGTCVCQQASRNVWRRQGRQHGTCAERVCAGVRQEMLQRLAHVRERARSLQSIQALDSSTLQVMELLLHCTEACVALDVYQALPSGAKAAVGAPKVACCGAIEGELAGPSAR